MKIPINWLKEFIDVGPSLEKLAEKLLQLGIEVERIEKSSSLQGIKIGEVLSVKKHPSADKLTVCMVDVGDGSPKQIICGASNVKEGIKVPVILPGSALPNGLKIEKRALRGIQSEGMICSKVELELEDDSDGLRPRPASPDVASQGGRVVEPAGIWILPDKCKVGEELSDEIETDDAVIDIKITPNRGDCLSIMGIARELAAITSQKLNIPKNTVKETSGKIKDRIDIKVENLDLCSRYTARMITDVQMGSSPCWMRRRLILAGVRPINNIVDVTNYVMLETGQPLHAFDYEKIACPPNLDGRKDKKIIVRQAKQNEKILCLDGVQRNLPSGAIVIADGKKPVALAGIMGGEETGVDKNTKNIVIESANFSPTLIRKTSKSLNVASESSYRFERGLDFEGTVFAANRACYLVQELSGGKVVSGTVDIQEKIAKKTIFFDPSQIKRILGVEIASYEKILKSLGFEVKKEKGYLKVQAPSWRNDIKEEIDLIEEIARVNNYDSIPLTLPSGKTPSLREDDRTKIINKCRSILNRLSLSETVNYSFLSGSLLKKSLVGIADEAIRIENAISEEFEILRTSLIPSLLQTAQENISKGEKNLKIFELRSVYKYKKGNLPEENIHLGILLSGDWQQPNWIDKGVKSSFYVLKGVIETLFDELGVKLDYKEEKQHFFSNGFSFSLFKDNVKVGTLGEVNSGLMDNFSLKEKTYVAEIDIESLIPSVRLAKKIKSLPKYPPITRDVSFLVPDDISSGKIENIMADEAKELLEDIKLFDYYKGKQVPEGLKSMSYSLSFRSKNKTLTDEEVNELQDKVIKKLEGLGLKLRS